MTDTPTITLSAQGIAPQLRKDEQGDFSLCFDLPGCRAEFALDETQVRALGLLCLHHFPDIEPRYAVPSEEEAFRLPARVFGLVDDRSLQILIRETQFDDLITFLWYMKDEELARRFFRNISGRAGEMLFEDLEARYGHLHPDTAPQVYVEKARAATLKIIETFSRLANEGQVSLH